MDDIQISSSSQVPAEADVYPLSSIEELERDFFTNFSCCDLVFPDLHALLDHYDITTGQHTHTSHATSPWTPMHSSPSPHSSPPSSPDSSGPDSPSGVPYPTHSLWSIPTRLTMTCGEWPSNIPMPPPYIYQPDAYVLSDFPTYEHCYHAATAPLSGPFMSETPQSLSALFAHSIGPILHSPTSSAPSSPSPTSSSSEGGKSRRRGETPTSPLMSRDSLTSALRKNGRRKGKVDLRGVPLAARRKGKRVFHCPTPGCTKTYLNPNGLKYHQEKGTCKIEDAVGVTPAPAAASGPQHMPASVTDDAVEFALPASSLAADAGSPPASSVPPVPEHEQHIYHPQPRQCLIGSADALAHWSGVAVDEPGVHPTDANVSVDLLVV